MNPSLDELRTLLVSARRIIWHRNSHLDDAAAQWFLRYVADVGAEFVYQPNDTIQIDPLNGEIGLDVMHEHAIKGYKLENGGYSSVFRCVVEAFCPEGDLLREALVPLVKWVDTNDSCGSVTRAWLGDEHLDIEAVGLNSLHESYKVQFPGEDEKAMRAFGESVLTPLMNLHRTLAVARCRMLEDCTFSLHGLIGVCDGPVPPEALRLPSRHLDQMARTRNQPLPQLLLYRDPNVGLGLVRIRGEIRLDDARLQKRISSPEWFFHPGGFLAACGTSTAPKNPENAGICLKDLLDFCLECFGSKEVHATL